MIKLSPFIPIQWKQPLSPIEKGLSKIQDMCSFVNQRASFIGWSSLGVPLVEVHYTFPNNRRRLVRILTSQITSLFMWALFRKKYPQKIVLQVGSLFMCTLPLLIPAFTALYRKFKGTPRIVRTIVRGKVIRKIIGEWSTNLKIRLPDRKEILWKEGQRRENVSEVATSPLAAYLTGGAVPTATMGKRKELDGGYVEGTLQPFLNLNTKPFVCLLKKESFNFNFLNTKQLHQLFIHVITDCMIFNFDTHQGQYALNKIGDVISLDKGQAFALFDLDKMKPDYLELEENPHLKDCVVNRRNLNNEKLYVRISSTFVREMRLDQKISPKNKIIQDFFKRCENLSQEKLKEWLYSFAQEFYPGKEAKFISFMLLRIRSIKPVVCQYFGWN